VNCYKNTIDLIREVLSQDKRVVFAYLYGSSVEGDKTQSRDIDIAVYAAEGLDGHEVSSDLKIALYEHTALSPDAFDIQIINNIVEEGDLFALLYLRNVFKKSILLKDRIPEVRSDFIEQYGLKFRECEGLISEILR